MRPLRVTITGKNVDITPNMREHTERKLRKISRYFSEQVECSVTMSVQKDRHIVEVTVFVSGLLIRAEESTGDMYQSINNVVEKIERQIRKYKTRINRQARRSAGEKPLVRILETEPDEVDEAADEEPRIVRTKRFPVKPMDPEEAVLQMNLLGHDFFVFRNMESEQVNVVYRRRDGHYGLIEPLP